MALPSPSIEALLPHRYPFLFVDRILAVEHGRKVQCGYRIPEDHPYLNRFSEPHVLPSSLVVEALGQAAALCLRSTAVEGPGHSRVRGYLVRIDGCTFHGQAHGGEELHLSASLVASYGPLHKFQATAAARMGTTVEAALTLFLED